VLLRGGLLVGLRLFDVIDVEGVGCVLLVLLDAAGISMVHVGCCMFGDVTSPGVSLGSGGLKFVHGRLRVLVCVVYLWWSRAFFLCAESVEGLGALRIRWVSIDLQYFLEKFRWGPDISRLNVLILNVLVGMDVCASCFPRRGEGGVEDVLMAHV